MPIDRRRLAYAADLDDVDVIAKIVREISPYVGVLKITPNMIIKGYLQHLRDLANIHDMLLFVDAKFHDIPNTVYLSVRAATQFADIVTVHVSGGAEMLKAAMKARDEVNTSTLLIGVTQLTSQTDSAVDSLAFSMSKTANDVGMDGVVCSGHEVAKIKEHYPQLKIVVPGIRMPGGETHDQARIVTPQEAIQKGADIIVMGRVITYAADRLKVLRGI